jgi:hypothetical protein
LKIKDHRGKLAVSERICIQKQATHGTGKGPSRAQNKTKGKWQKSKA